MKAAEARHMNKVAALGCVICRRLSGEYVPAEIHHVAEGSGLRSNYAIAGLCPEHHRGQSGFHTMQKQWLKLFRIHNETEYGLLVMVNEDIARYG